jgi:hypothetical protein
MSGGGGTAGQDATAKGGKSGSGGAAASGGSSAGKGGFAGEAGGESGPAGKGGKGGSGGTGGDPSRAGGDDGKDHEPDDGQGGADDGEGGMGGDSGSEPEVDDIPPGIVEVSPAQGATGVDDDAEIVITFDEPMDNASTEAAFVSALLPQSDVDLYWRDSSRQLIVKPREKLKYADVMSPTGAAMTYVFTIAGTAKDVAGNPLGTDRTYTFTTYRHVTHSLPVPAYGGRLVIEDKAPLPRCGGDDSGLVAGDSDLDEGHAFLVSFDISSIPDGVVKWGDTDLHMMLETTRHLPYRDRLGDLHYLSTVVAPDAFSWTNPIETDLGVFASNGAATDVRHGVRDALAADYAERVTRGNLSQYALRFDKRSDYDGEESQVEARCGDVSLDLEYWVP